MSRRPNTVTQENEAQTQAEDSATLLDQTTDKIAEKPQENAQLSADNPAPEDLRYFLNNMRLSNQNALGISKLRWKRSEDKLKYKEHWIMEADAERFRGQLAERFMVEVVRGGAILGVPFSVLLDDSTYDDGDRVKSQFRRLNKETNSYQSEMRCFLQPIGAARAMNQKRRELMEAKTERKAKERAAEERENLAQIARDFKGASGQSMRNGAAKIDIESYGEHSGTGYGGR